MSRARNEQRVVLRMAVEVLRDGCVDDQPDEGLGRREPASQEDVCRDEYGTQLLKEALGEK